MGRKPLSEKEVEARLDYAKTHQPEEFAMEFGVALSSARTYYSKYNICRPRKPLFLDDTEAREFTETHTTKESAEHFGVTCRTMYKRIKESNVTPLSPWKKKTADRDAMIVYLSKAFTLEAIGQVFNMTKQRVSQIANRKADEE